MLDQSGLSLWWDGYLAEPAGGRLIRDLARAGVPFQSVHTSGHASVTDRRRLVTELKPRCVVLIDTEAASRFNDLFANVGLHIDGASRAA